MFDADSVRREMELLFGAAAADRARAPNAARAPTVTSEPPAARPKRTVAGRRGMLLVTGLMVATIVIPLLVVAGSLAVPAWKKRMSGAPFAVVPAATLRAGARAPAASPSGTSPGSVSAYTVVMHDKAPGARAAPQRRWRRARSGRRAWRRERAGSALERAVAEDAVVTKRLNDAAIDRLRPTLGYSPAIVDQVPPR